MCRTPSFGLIVFSFPTVGFVVLLRRPRTNLGWLMLSMGIAFALPFAVLRELRADAGRRRRCRAPAIALALSEPAWVPFIGISGYLLLLFPDGHLPSPRWRWFAWLCGIGLVALSILIAFTPGTFEDLGYPNITNPLGIEALGRSADGSSSSSIFAPLTVVGGAVAVDRPPPTRHRPRAAPAAALARLDRGDHRVHVRPGVRPASDLPGDAGVELGELARHGRAR